MQDEHVVGVIPGAVTKTGMFSSKTYTLVFTSHRLILAEATKALVAAEVERARAAAKEQGKNVFGQIGAQLRTTSRFGIHYAGADPKAVLGETPGNVALARPDVRGLKVDRKTSTMGPDDDVEAKFLRVTLESRDGKKTYDTSDEHPSLDEARALVEGFLAGR